MEELYTVDQVAARYGVKRRTVLNWVAKGLIASRKVSQKRYFTAGDLESFEAAWEGLNG